MNPEDPDRVLARELGVLWDGPETLPTASYPSGPWSARDRWWVYTVERWIAEAQEWSVRSAAWHRRRNWWMLAALLGWGLLALCLALAWTGR